MSLYAVNDDLCRPLLIYYSSPNLYSATAYTDPSSLTRRSPPPDSLFVYTSCTVSLRPPGLDETLVGVEVGVVDPSDRNNTGSRQGNPKGIHRKVNWGNTKLLEPRGETEICPDWSYE